jgi:hypothetical protein
MGGGQGGAASALVRCFIWVPIAVGSAFSPAGEFCWFSHVEAFSSLNTTVFKDEFWRSDPRLNLGLSAFGLEASCIASIPPLDYLPDPFPCKAEPVANLSQGQTT